MVWETGDKDGELNGMDFYREEQTLQHTIAEIWGSVQTHWVWKRPWGSSRDAIGRVEKTLG